MSHKTLISGTSYAIKGGTDLIAGTSYQIGGAGRTLVDGTAYEIKLGESLTWKINTEIDRATELWENVIFYSNGKKYVRFATILGEPYVYIRYYTSQYAYDTVYKNWWLSGYTAYRTITFAEPPTGKLLTWLQANAVQQ